MTSRTTERFRVAFAGLPGAVQRRARRAYLRFRENPSHPSLQFKQVHAERLIYSVRISLAYRALCVKDGEVLVWFWLGSHEEYERLISKR